MTRVDFYILKSDSKDNYLRFVTRLTEKAYRLGHTVFIQTQNNNETGVMDELLWEHNVDSFLAHGVSGSEEHTPAPIELSHTAAPAHHHDVLINMGTGVPEYFGRFQRVAEVVLQSDEMRQKSRENWRFYNSRGYPLKLHHIE